RLESVALSLPRLCLLERQSPRPQYLTGTSRVAVDAPGGDPHHATSVFDCAAAGARLERSVAGVLRFVSVCSRFAHALVRARPRACRQPRRAARWHRARRGGGPRARPAALPRRVAGRAALRRRLARLAAPRRGGWRAAVARRGRATAQERLRAPRRRPPQRAAGAGRQRGPGVACRRPRRAVEAATAGALAGVDARGGRAGGGG